MLDLEKQIICDFYNVQKLWLSTQSENQIFLVYKKMLNWPNMTKMLLGQGVFSCFPPCLPSNQNYTTGLFMFIKIKTLL